MHRVAEAGVIALGDPRTVAPPERPEPQRTVARLPTGSGPTRPGPAGSPGCWSGRATPPTPTPSGRSCATSWRRTGRSPSTAPSPERRPARRRRRRCRSPPARPASTPPTPGYGEAAHRCIGARVNGRLTALSTVLRDGDALQLFLEPGRRRPSGPSPGVARARPYAGRADRHPALARRPSPFPAGVDGGRGQRLRAEATRRPRRAATAALGIRSGASSGRRQRGARRSAHETAADEPPPSSPATRTPRAARPLLHARTAGRRHRVPGARRHRHRPPRRVPGGGPDGLRRAARPCRCAGSRARRDAGSPCAPRRLAGRTCWPTSPRPSRQQGAAVVSADVEPPREQRVRHTYTLQLPDAAGLPALMRAMRRGPGRLRRHAGPPARPPHG